jgi:pSer/pThr/pTyr-binding forkhead associated (FHA) protein
MLQLQILSGKRAGETFDGNARVVTVGRSEQADVVLDDPGVWLAHCRIFWDEAGVNFEVAPQAMASINGVPVANTLLHNGDIITLGGVNLRFGYSPVRQSSMALREWLTWIALGGLCAVQVAVIYWLC